MFTPLNAKLGRFVYDIIMLVELLRDGDSIGAMIGPDLQTGVAGFGYTAPEALRALADAIERENYPLPELEPPAPKLKRVK